MLFIELIQSIGLLSGIFFIIGFILVVIEMFVPGFGFPGVIGFIMLGIGVFVTANTLVEMFLLVMIILIILGIMISILLQAAKRGKLSKGIILSTSMIKSNKDTINEDIKYFLGKKGITLTVLRPSGTIDLEGVRLDVVSRGEYIEKDVEVKIIKIEGRKIIVKKI